MSPKKQIMMWDSADRGLITVISGIFMAFFVIMLIQALGGCTPQANGQWPPDIAFSSAHVSGSIELATPAGPVTIDLGTGIVSGSGEVEIVKANIDAGVEFTVNDLKQRVEIQSPGQNVDDKWLQCFKVKFATEVSIGAAIEWESPLICPSAEKKDVEVEQGSPPVLE